MQLRDVEPGSTITIPMFNDGGKQYTVRPSRQRYAAPDIEIMASDGEILLAPCQLLVELKSCNINIIKQGGNNEQ